jgi:hypothetical protein
MDPAALEAVGVGGGVVPMVLEAVGVAAAWTQRRQRGHGKFWPPDGVQVKIL